MTSYLDHHENRGRRSVLHSWADHTRRALAWQYGETRADAIMAGRDPKTQADLAAWRQLGRRRVA